MSDKNPSETPNEIPTHKHPGQQAPLKDPNLAPGKDNPINPETDEPSKQK